MLTAVLFMLVVLIGDTDSGQHTVAPVFKIGDLGLGRAVDDPIFEYPCVHQ